MFHDPAFTAMFGTTVDTLKPYLEDIVCIGGCANALYRYHDRASTPAPEYLGTKDSDWALPTTLPQRTEVPLARLMENAGFVEELGGTAKEPVVKYRPAATDVPADIEFLCPLSGAPGGRTGDCTTVEVQPGLKAQPLRYLQILMQHPWQVELGKAPELRRFKGVLIQVPNPAAYVVQKILIRKERRKSESMAKDCYYIYEVSVVFRDNFAALAEEYTLLKEYMSAPWIKHFERDVRQLFRDEHAEGTTAALDVSADSGRGGSPLSADIIARAVARMLDVMEIP